MQNMQLNIIQSREEEIIQQVVAIVQQEEWYF